MAAVRPTSASTHAPTPFGQAPAPAAHPHFLQSFDRQTHEAYLKSRGVAYLQRHYRELLKVPEGEEFPPFNPPNALKRGARGGGGAAAEGDGGAGSSSKKARVAGPSGGAAYGPGAGTGDTEAEASQAGESGVAAASAASAPAASTAGAAVWPSIPHIDSTYLLELTTAKPEAGVLALGDPAQDVYLPILGSRQRREDHRALIGALIDRAMESETLFWDLRRLDHDQVRALAEVEWSRQLPLTAGQPSSLSEERESAAAAAAASASAALPSASRGGKRAQGQAAAVPQQPPQPQTEEERAMDEEIAQIRRSFCDKTRAQALASRAAAGW